MKPFIIGSLLAALCLSAAPAPSAAMAKSGGTISPDVHSTAVAYACRQPRGYRGWFGSRHGRHGWWGHGHQRDSHWGHKGRRHHGHFDGRHRGHRYGSRQWNRGGRHWHD